MPPKGKGKKRVQKKGQDLVEDDTREEQESPEGRPEINLVIGDVPQASQFQPLQLDQPDDDSDGTNITVTGKRTSLSHNFPSEQEERLVEFFKGHECFYNKADARYFNTQYKNKLMDQLAKELGSDLAAVKGWFKTQRTAVGRLLKKTKKSGSGQPVLTVRQKWQMSNFKFLKQHIVPRSYTQDSGDLPPPESDDEDDDEQESSIYQPSTSAVQSPTGSQDSTQSSSTSHKPGDVKRSSKIEDALLTFLIQLVALESAPKDERSAFAAYFNSRLPNIATDDWLQFQKDINNTVDEYILRAQQQHQLQQQHPQQMAQCMPQSTSSRHSLPTQPKRREEK